MEWSQTLQTGLFIRRYKRFFADIQMPNGNIEVAHVPNTGSLKGCLIPGCEALVLPTPDPKKKLQWSLKALKSKTGGWIGVDTGVPSRILNETLKKNPSILGSPIQSFKLEHKINSETRLDALAITEENKKLFIELKNVTLAHCDTDSVSLGAYFPDAKTTRGQKHLKELMTLVEEGHLATLIFMVQRTDCEYFSPADDIDPEYARLLKRAQLQGVQCEAWLLEVSPQGVFFTGKKIPLILN